MSDQATLVEPEPQSRKSSNATALGLPALDFKQIQAQSHAHHALPHERRATSPLQSMPSRLHKASGGERTTKLDESPTFASTIWKDRNSSKVVSERHRNDGQAAEILCPSACCMQNAPPQQADVPETGITLCQAELHRCSKPSSLIEELLDEYLDGIEARQESRHTSQTVSVPQAMQIRFHTFSIQRPIHVNPVRHDPWIYDDWSSLLPGKALTSDEKVELRQVDQVPDMAYSWTSEEFKNSSLSNMRFSQQQQQQLFRSSRKLAFDQTVNVAVALPALAVVAERGDEPVSIGFTSNDHEIAAERCASKSLQASPVSSPAALSSWSARRTIISSISMASAVPKGITNPERPASMTLLRLKGGTGQIPAFATAVEKGSRNSHSRRDPLCDITANAQWPLVSAGSTTMSHDDLEHLQCHR